LLARLKHAGTDDAFGVHENVRAAIIRFDESKPAMLVPSAAVALNSLAETTLQKIPPDPASAQCISKRRPSGTGSAALQEQGASLPFQAEKRTRTYEWSTYDAIDRHHSEPSTRPKSSTYLSLAALFSPAMRPPLKRCLSASPSVAAEA